MSKSKLRLLLISIFFISLIVWIVLEISEKMEKDRQYEATRKKLAKSMDSIIVNTNKPREINILEIHEKLKQEKVYKEDEIIKKDPKNAQAYFDRGVKKLEFLDKKGALADFDKAIELEPKSAESYYYRYQCYNVSILGFEDLNKAISLNPKYTEAYCSRGILKMTSDISGACKDWKMARKLGDTSCNKMIESYCN